MWADFALKDGGMDRSGLLYQDYVGHAFERLVTERHIAVGEVIAQQSLTDLDRHGAKRQVDVGNAQRPCPPPLDCGIPCTLDSR